MGDGRDRAEHYFSAQPASAAREREVEFSVAGRTFRLLSAAGVFSAQRLDPATSVLLRKAELPPARTTGLLLDLGCGYGAIACVLATVAPRATVYAVDVNTRALRLVATNARRVGAADRIRALTPDEFDDQIDQMARPRFAQIWSNPPIRIGKPGLHEMLSRWLPWLEPTGTAWLVVSRHLGADSLAGWLAERGYGVVRHASASAFRVLRVSPAPGHDLSGG